MTNNNEPTPEQREKLRKMTRKNLIPILMASTLPILSIMGSIPSEDQNVYKKPDESVKDRREVVNPFSDVPHYLSQYLKYTNQKKTK